MNIGTRSVLFGYHCFFLHPLFVARGWYLLHGFRDVTIARQGEDGEQTWFTNLLDPRLWLAFFLHDLGYWGKPNMDGEEGELHPLWAANIMSRLFGPVWGEFCLYHSRFLAKRDGEDPSVLCAPDKLAVALYPRWLFLLLVSLTGEVHEYMRHSKVDTTKGQWADDCRRFSREYGMTMKDGGADTVTGSAADSNKTDRLNRPARNTGETINA